jgi:ubiquinone/menaquinone biosynthesis C-methylase UbiE
MAIVIALIFLGAMLLLAGRPRLRFPRQPGLAGIEDAQVVQAYDRINRWPQFQALRWMVVRRLSAMRPAGLLADLGCGPGLLTLMIGRQFPALHVIGLDRAEEMLEVAAAHAEAQGLSERMLFRKGDIEHLPLVDASLDVAVSSLSLHHWLDPQRALAEVHRVLKPGGQVLLFDLRRDARRFFYWLLRFAQGVVVPEALRAANEPLGSLLASYSLPELEALMGGSAFGQWRVEGGAAWVFVWGARKGSKECMELTGSVSAPGERGQEGAL